MLPVRPLRVARRSCRERDALPRPYSQPPADMRQSTARRSPPTRADRQLEGLASCGGNGQTLLRPLLSSDLMHPPPPSCRGTVYPLAAHRHLLIESGSAPGPHRNTERYGHRQKREDRDGPLPESVIDPHHAVGDDQGGVLASVGQGDDDAWDAGRSDYAAPDQGRDHATGHDGPKRG